MKNFFKKCAGSIEEVPSRYYDQYNLSLEDPSIFQKNDSYYTIKNGTFNTHGTFVGNAKITENFTIKISNGQILSIFDDTFNQYNIRHIIWDDQYDKYPKLTPPYTEEFFNVGKIQFQEPRILFQIIEAERPEKEFKLLCNVIDGNVVNQVEVSALKKWDAATGMTNDWKLDDETEGVLDFAGLKEATKHIKISDHQLSCYLEALRLSIAAKKKTSIQDSINAKTGIWNPVDIEQFIFKKKYFFNANLGIEYGPGLWIDEVSEDFQEQNQQKATINKGDRIEMVKLIDLNDGTEIFIVDADEIKTALYQSRNMLALGKIRLELYLNRINDIGFSNVLSYKTVKDITDEFAKIHTDALTVVQEKYFSTKSKKNGKESKPIVLPDKYEALTKTEHKATYFREFLDKLAQMLDVYPKNTEREAKRSLTKKELKDMFNTIDTKKMGTINAKQFLAAFKPLGKELANPSKIEALFKSLNIDENGIVHFKEFHKFYLENKPKEKYAKAFEKHDLWKTMLEFVQYSDGSFGRAMRNLENSVHKLYQKIASEDGSKITIRMYHVYKYDGANEKTWFRKYSLCSEHFVDGQIKGENNLARDYVASMNYNPDEQRYTLTDEQNDYSYEIMKVEAKGQPKGEQADVVHVYEANELVCKLKALEFIGEDNLMVTVYAKRKISHQMRVNFNKIATNITKKLGIVYKGKRTDAGLYHLFKSECFLKIDHAIGFHIFEKHFGSINGITKRAVIDVLMKHFSGPEYGNKRAQLVRWINSLRYPYAEGSLIIKFEPKRITPVIDIYINDEFIKYLQG